ncbi:hypothetical protein M404DRAFT_424659 [Pisolithus tinctorius Marx 270]|uniref:Uncharacterized protein n=1 Tax=Pisolithus tinctorius Marx 270 TaxID=870435 RepID=A0A0C3PFF1_PISTI|nr:hypothetical protein M404DRAFT_424659 [Pisolithus tinctorius Marx 270]
MNWTMANGSTKRLLKFPITASIAVNSYAVFGNAKTTEYYCARSDETNVSVLRLLTAEVESALMLHEGVAEAEVIGTIELTWHVCLRRVEICHVRKRNANVATS